MGNILKKGSKVSENDGFDDDKLKENDVKMENVNETSELIEDNFEEEEEEIDNEDESEENVFHVGDFVWGEEVNTHQWWPGQIYDSSDASDLALKQLQKGKLLVAYFGDKSFAWCNPLELKPFLENFKEFSKMSDSLTFLSAVEEAVVKIGEHVEQFLVCNESSALVSSVAVNSGIKEGVVVPDVRREIVSSLVLENHPGVVLDDIKRLAKTVRFSDLLKIEVLKRKLSVFYRLKGRFDLAKFDEHQYIRGLEHREDEIFERSLRKCSEFVRKKRKYCDEVNLGDVATTTGSTTSRRRRSSEEELSNEKRNDDEGIEKREESNDSNHIEESEKKNDSSIEIDLSIRKRLRVDVSSRVERISGNGETIVQTGKRERKKSKYLSPEYMTDFSWRSRKKKVEPELVQIRVPERMTIEKSIGFVTLGTSTLEELLDLIRGAALGTHSPEDYNSSCDMIKEFVSIYRSLKYHDGVNNKRNISDEVKQQVMDEKEQTRDDEPENLNEKT